MSISYRHAAQVAGLWLFLVVVSLYGRSYFPIDETRYMAVAWNMWLSGDFLVPYLDGVAYSHKPPLLFWLINLGWAIFGVNDWWPRLVPSLFALGSACLTIGIAGRLWPHGSKVAQTAPVILFGSLLWTVFTTATMFDMMVAFFTVLGMLGILVAWQDRSARGWLLLGLAIGGGLLAKGPTILLQLLPLALMAPWWSREGTLNWGRWYGGILGAVLLGASIALVWAVPAGMHCGAVYQHAIFWGQTADRMVDSFAHRQPFWWYLLMLPIMLFPWLLWPPVWRGAVRLGAVIGEPGVRFCLAWSIPVFIAFSLISGKQMHYLLPIFPAFALLAARMLDGVPENSRWDAVPVALALLAIGAAFLYLPYYPRTHSAALWVKEIPVWSGPIFILAAVTLLLIRSRDRLAEVWKMAMLSALVVTLVYFAIIRAAGTAYDMRPISAKLKQLEEAGVPVVHEGGYSGTFNFLGRLKTPPEITSRANLANWLEAHPEGRAIVYFDKSHPVDGLRPEFIQLYRGQQVAIVNRQQWQEWQEWCAAHQTKPGAC